MELPMAKGRRKKSKTVVEQLLTHLRSCSGGAEPYVFIAEAELVLQAILEGIFREAKEPKTDVESLMKLGAALESDLKPPTAADVIRRVLSADRRVLVALGMGEEDERNRQRACVEQWCGRMETSQAPKLDESQPEG